MPKSILDLCSLFSGALFLTCRLIWTRIISHIYSLVEGNLLNWLSWEQERSNHRLCPVIGVWEPTAGCNVGLVSY